MPIRSLVLFLFVFCACQPQPGGPPVYVGAVDDSDALIAIAPEGTDVVAYVCAEQTWAEHSGWFFTELVDGAVKPATSGTGHVLDNVTLEADRARGRIRFADGSEHGFTAYLADGRTSAGLYESHASEGQAGLIITNDGRAAGAVKLPTGTEEPAVTGAITVNQPVGSGTTGTGGISVTLPTLGDRTLTLISVSKTLVSRTGPTLYILVHGMNHPVGSDPALVDTPQQSRTEWHLDFIQGLLGGADPAQNGGAHAQMFNFAGDLVTQQNFMSPALLPPFDSFAPEAAIANLDTVAKHFITMDPRTGDARRNDVVAPSQRRPFPMASVFVTYRDASAGLVESGKRIANETYVAIRWYEEHFNRTPKIVYVAQSFGGVTARFVLSNPTQALVDFPGAPAMNADRIVITAEDRRRMDYVRDRIMYLVTMGTPHEGSFMGDLFVPLQQTLQALTQSLEGGTANVQANLQALATFIGRIDDLTALALQRPQTSAQTAAETLQVVRNALAEVSRNLNGRALRDLRHDYWQRVNTIPLNPARARRTSASPIPGAGGQLIPIYAAGARTPGGLAFTAPELSAFTRLNGQNKKEQEWMVNTMVTDIVIHTLRVNQNGFGRSDQGIYAGFDALLDRRERIADGSAFARQLAQNISSQVNPFVADALGNGDAVEAILRPLMGDARLVSLPVYLDRKGSFDLGGSVTVPVPELRCVNDDGTVEAITLDFGRLVRAMISTYGSLTAARNALRTLDLNGVLQQLSIASDDASDVATWFLEKYGQAAVPAGRCRLPSDVSISSLFAAVNLPNWSVAEGTDELPAPRWVFSNTPASDDEIDDDGVVGFESAVGFSLGTTTPLFFEHTRNDAANGQPGSWYRIFTSPLERECHGMQHQWNIGKWARDEFANAGPVPASGGTLSVFP